MMATLPRRQEEALRLRDRGMSYSQIAAEMNVTPAAVGMLITRARDKLGIPRGPSRWRKALPLTATQRAYLDTFDADLKANRWKSPQSRELFDLLLAEAGVEPEGHQRYRRSRARDDLHIAA